MARGPLRILQRYIWRELTFNFLGVTVLLLAILLIYQGGAVLARAAEFQYPATMVLRLFALGALQNVSLLLPFGLLLSIVLTFGRLYHDSELFAAQACGFGTSRSLVVVLAVTVPVVVLAAGLDLALAPRAAAAESQLRAAALRSALASPLQPGRFRTLAGGRTVVYARSAAADGELEDVFVKRTTSLGVETTVARRARYLVSADGRAQTITLYDGERMEGKPGGARYRIMRFASQTIPIAMSEPAQRAEELESTLTRRLFGDSSAEQLGELQRRFRWPLMTLVLGVCALPLARLRPRQGRFSRVAPAVLLFALYANLLQVAGLWLQRGQLSASAGLWGVHVLFALLALVLAGSSWPRWRSARA